MQAIHIPGMDDVTEPRRTGTGAASGALRGRMLTSEPMAKHTSWRVGGPADRFYVATDVEDLAQLLRNLPAQEPLVWVGLGSNLLVRDGGIRGTVILLSGLLGEIELRDEREVIAGAGAPCARVARFGATHGLAGAEFLAGIPGTVGGALAMNAGAFGRETWNIVERVETIDRHGTKRHRKRSEFRVGYRTVVAPAEEWYLAAEFLLQADPSRQGPARIRRLLEERAERQPTGVFSCGSVFRNPEGDYAGRLIEKCGLKGERVGHASVSTKHANFIINEGGATAAEIEELILHVQDAVKAMTGVRLVPEVRIVGEAPRPRGENHVA
ncbi:MAG: UDP-N-acetylmuramate dehydrogenase [Gammaproteobacteria bacterium]|nr:UDP-N-acetylmuramate dehydrogenase [Gammaproteobacteria bacterium]